MWITNVDEERRLIEKLQKIETLFARTTSPGERQAAESALDRIRGRLARIEVSEPPVDFRFSLADSWSTALFIALVRRYGLKPYRYSSQRRTTVIVKVAPSFVDEVLWPEFQQVNATLRSHLDTVTTRIIQEAIHHGGADVEERPMREPVGHAARSRE
jgi:hypothetical protein